MKPTRIVAFILAALVMVISFAGVPAIAQRGAATALDKKSQSYIKQGKSPKPSR